MSTAVAPGGIATTPEESLVLLAVAASASPLSRALPAGPVDWGVVADLAEEGRVLALVAARLEERLPQGPSDALRLRGTAERRRAEQVDATVELVSFDLLARLDAAGVPAVALKGPQLGRRLYGAGSLRSRSQDVDVLVAPAALETAVAVAAGMGYERVDEPLDRDGRPLLHVTLRGPSSAFPAIELHWRVHWYEDAYAEQALGRVRGVGVERRLAPVDEAVMLLLFFVRDGLQGVRYPADLAAWWDAHADELSATGVRELLRRHPALAPAVGLAARAIDRFVGTGYAGVVGAVPAGRARLRLASRVATPFPDRRDESVDARTAIVDVLASPSGVLRRTLVRRVVPRAGLEQRLPDRREIVRGAPHVLGRLRGQLGVLARSGR